MFQLFFSGPTIHIQIHACVEAICFSDFFISKPGDYDLVGISKNQYEAPSYLTVVVSLPNIFPQGCS